MLVRNSRHYWFAAALIAATPVHAQMAQPGVAPAKGPDVPDPQSSDAEPQQGPIVPENEFDAALPPLTNDMSAPLEPMTPAQPVSPGTTVQRLPGATAPQSPDALAPIPPTDPSLSQPLVPLGQFDTTPLQTVTAEQKGKNAPLVRYDTIVKGLDDLNLTGRFKSLSALEDGDGKAANPTQVQARAKEDEALAVRLMKSLGYYDGSAISTIDIIPTESTDTPSRLRVTISATPGKLYTFSSITIDAQPTVPPKLVDKELPLKVGDPIDAARVEGAEANVSLTLPQQGYPFVKVEQRDILLDDQTPTGAYTLPVDTGPRSSFGRLVTAGDPVFDLKHLSIFPRFDRGELYDVRLVDDLREALVATSLFSSVSVEPQQTSRDGPDGTKQVDLLVRQVRGKNKNLSGAAGYSTGQGFRLEGQFTNRNRFPPEGALIFGAIGGTQEQGLSATFKRSNAGRRDRTVSLTASALHQNYDAFSAFTGLISGRISYDSTPIWQKKFTYSYGFELVGTNESVYDFTRLDRVRRTYFIFALPGQAVFDHSDSLLNPTRGYRLKLNFSPETSVQGAVSPYARTMVEGTAYYPVSPSLVLAGRLRAGSIFGIARDDLAPSRRYYGGGGGSVRGYGYQRLGPLDPNGDPVGGRSLNEFSLEARYRFGNFGIVPFFDGGQTYEGSLPKGSNLQYGAGIGGRFYTNFGPLRVDVATPLNPRPGDSRIALYISIGQAF